MAKLFTAAGTVVRPLLRSPLHRAVSGQLMLLRYTGGRSGRSYSFPIGYFSWDDAEVVSFSSRRWPFALRQARDIELLIRRTAFPATAEVMSDPQEKAALLAEFARRKGPRTARRLMLGLPGDRLPTAEEAADAATATTIVRFRLGARTAGASQE
ncbi:MAG TPA: hypothetical protein VHC41_06220 [Mycobacteriales bacterium]|nr:hypothetical protein [Mycobacteriales bacterium]